MVETHSNHFCSHENRKKHKTERHHLIGQLNVEVHFALSQITHNGLTIFYNHQVNIIINCVHFVRRITIQLWSISSCHNHSPHRVIAIMVTNQLYLCLRFSLYFALSPRRWDFMIKQLIYYSNYNFIIIIIYNNANENEILFRAWLKFFSLLHYTCENRWIKNLIISKCKRSVIWYIQTCSKMPERIQLEKFGRKKAIWVLSATFWLSTFDLQWILSLAK